MKQMTDSEEIIDKYIYKLYPHEVAEYAISAIIDLIFKYKQRIEYEPCKLSEKDVILITYGDQVSRDHEATLQTLCDFMDKHLQNIINSVHILPFYPSSSDDGFSVVNYSAVDPNMGSWREIENISSKYRLMVDGVINHVSQFSNWFKAYLNNDKYYKDFFIEVDPSTDLSKVIRPRTCPLLNEFIDNDGKIHNIWTTFSKDQVDLNYKNYRVLYNVLDALFYYIEKGATLIRLDAIAFIWKEIGTECVNLPQTHELIQLMCEVLHAVSPGIIIITETNIPHNENISYFGNGDDEAKMIYNFALPPLLIHSVLHGNAKILTQWAQSLRFPNEKVCFFNFTASHDGIGLRPVKEIISDDDINYMVSYVQNNGGLVSFRTEENGKESPYELNCSYIDALTHPKEDNALRFKKMFLTQGVVLAMPGIPGIYFHSLVGSRNYIDGVKHTGINRSINREKLNADWLENELSIQGSLAKTMFDSYKRIISIRINEAAFNPFGDFKFFNIDERLFVIERNSIDKKESVLAIHNFANETVSFTIPEDITLPLNDILSSYAVDKTRKVTLEPYQMMWLKNKSTHVKEDNA